MIIFLFSLINSLISLENSESQVFLIFLFLSINKEEIEEIVKNFSKDKHSEVVTLSTLDKNLISKIKTKLLSYVS